MSPGLDPLFDTKIARSLPCDFAHYFLVETTFRLLNITVTDRDNCPRVYVALTRKSTGLEIVVPKRDRNSSPRRRNRCVQRFFFGKRMGSVA